MTILAGDVAVRGYQEEEKEKQVFRGEEENDSGREKEQEKKWDQFKYKVHIIIINKY